MAGFIVWKYERMDGRMAGWIDGTREGRCLVLMSVCLNVYYVLCHHVLACASCAGGWVVQRIAIKEGEMATVEVRTLSGLEGDGYLTCGQRCGAQM